MTDEEYRQDFIRYHFGPSDIVTSGGQILYQVTQMLWDIGDGIPRFKAVQVSPPSIASYTFMTAGFRRVKRGSLGR